MSTLIDFTTAACACDDVLARLLSHNGGVATVPLCMKFADLRIERDVEIRLATKPAYPGYRLLDVSWRPKDGGPYPSFEGTLSVEDEGPGWSRIEINGQYKPPFGVLGAAFDAAVGHRIAEATAAELLAEFKRILTPANSATAT